MTRRRLSSDLRLGGAIALVACLHVLTVAAQPDTTVGMTGNLEGVVLPGTELEAVPRTDRDTDVVLRVSRVYPHGTAFRYDLEYFGLAPGPHDLRQYLRRKDGSSAADLPPIPVTVTPTLPPGQVQPNKLEIEAAPRLGGYRTLVIVVGTVWAVGLILLVGSFFFPRRRTAVEATDRPVSLAERLAPLVEGAVAGTLSRAELANLERALLAYWRKRLRLEAAEPGAAVESLRTHPDAGPLLAQLEAWLHRPGPAAPVDTAALLAPYRGLPPDAMDVAGGAA